MKVVFSLFGKNILGKIGVNIVSDFGRVLRVDLSSGTSKIEKIDQETVSRFIGGRGLGAKIMWDEVGPAIEALSPENKVILATGPLTGTGFPTASRVIMLTKSPLTGTYMYTMAGGRLGANMRQAGYDIIIVEGKAEKPVNLLITPDGIKVREAQYLWGMGTTLALYHLKNEIGSSFSGAIIGPAGENLIPYAGVSTDDWRQFGRGGLGAVMGSKNLKAIMVEKGHKQISMADPGQYKQIFKRIMTDFKAKPGNGDSFARYGTGESQEARSALGGLPTSNWAQCTFSKARDISMNYMRDNLGLVVKDTGCFGCPLRCGKLTLVKEGPFAGASCDGPEYESIFALGSACGIGDPEAIIAANQLCDELGLDTISAGVSIAFAMECFERGYLTREDTGGLEVRFGNSKAVLALLEDIAYRRGFGALLAMGTKRVAEQIGQGSEYFAMHVKGMELGGYEPRTAKGQAIVFAAGNRGGCHHAIGLPVFEELKLGIHKELKGKGELVKRHAALRIIQDSGPNCTFAYNRSFDWQNWSELLSAALGHTYTIEDLYTAAARINTLERCYNIREGFTSADDTLPGRLMEEPVPDGPGSGERVSPEDLRNLLEQYYTAMNWDTDTGIPKKETLEKLNLEWVKL